WMVLRLRFRFAQLVPRSVVFQRPPSLATSSALPLKSSAWKSGWTTPPLYGRIMSAYDAPPSLVASAVMQPTTIVLALLGSTATGRGRRVRRGVVVGPGVAVGAGQDVAVFGATEIAGHRPEGSRRVLEDLGHGARQLPGDAVHDRWRQQRGDLRIPRPGRAAVRRGVKP